MQLGMIGLGRMGANMTRRLVRGGHSLVVYDRNPEATKELGREGATGASSVEELVRGLEPPRAVWVMVPAGAPTDSAVTTLASLMSPGDVVIDGGNTFFKDDIRRARVLKTKQVHYVDVGTSGGIWGLARGYCLMIGGETEVVRRLDPIFRTLAPGGEGAGDSASTAELGYLHCGPPGSGHFVKMIHNGI